MKIKDITLNKDETLIKALEMIKNSGLRCIIITNEIKVAIGTLSEGDILDGILRGQSIHSPIKNFFNRNFTFLNDKTTNQQKNVILFENFKKGITIIPVLNDKGIPVNYYDYREFLNKKN